ncbi:hypothetical protein [Rugamonas sp.]|uniref:hypothetical protein n=1 Tax=Rugamonas sp. TaxID=1926287 RepID=UPI0025EA7050|nr:hypothetical protein [Rugamonas sp.]
MTSRLNFKYHKGQELTKTGYPHVHCIITSYCADELSYIVSYTCSANIKKVSEATLNALYLPSAGSDKQDAMEHLCERMGKQGYLDEDGEPAAPH